MLPTAAQTRAPGSFHRSPSAIHQDKGRVGGSQTLETSQACLGCLDRWHPSQNGYHSQPVLSPETLASVWDMKSQNEQVQRNRSRDKKSLIGYECSMKIKVPWCIPRAPALGDMVGAQKKPGQHSMPVQKREKNMIPIPETHLWEKKNKQNY